MATNLGPNNVGTQARDINDSTVTNIVIHGENVSAADGTQAEVTAILSPI